MKNFTVIKHATVITTLTTFSSLATALPITFDFTGTISSHIFSNGTLQPITQLSQLLGKTVSGSFVLDVDGLETNPNQSPDQVYYDSYYGNNSSDWLSFTFKNPDGRIFNFPDTNLSGPPEVDGSRTYITYRPSFADTRFYVDRIYSNTNTFPRTNISLRLWSWGSDALKMVNGLDYHTLDLQPEYADWENYGIVAYNNGAGRRINYYFTIDSITRRASVQVDEPSTVSLLIFSMSLLLWHRRNTPRKKAM